MTDAGKALFLFRESNPWFSAQSGFWLKFSVGVQNYLDSHPDFPSRLAAQEQPK